MPVRPAAGQAQRAAAGRGRARRRVGGGPRVALVAGAEAVSRPVHPYVRSLQNITSKRPNAGVPLHRTSVASGHV